MGKECVCPYCKARMDISNGEKPENCDYCGAELSLSQRKTASHGMQEESDNKISYKKKLENKLSYKMKLKKWKREAATVAALEAISFFVSIVTMTSVGENEEMSLGLSAFCMFTLFFAIAIVLFAPVFLGRKRPAEYGKYHTKDIISLYVLYIGVLALTFMVSAVVLSV